ncbi:TlpA disulfide reductase family protein [Inediibacterium massiliense]|uniref:TlpA disulfide reductase family protein n=1 Tax=Inediibacterium massiliense TaxID=1658111 RepID=UPI0006B4BEEA|nr:TlpA disulfide reductase family protein [Inediibacterium massiliense]
MIKKSIWIGMVLGICLSMSGCLKDMKEVESIKKEETTKKSEVYVGEQAYDFTLLDREGNEIRLSDLKEKVVLINFFTTKSPNAVKELKDLQQVYEKYEKDDVVTLAVNVLAAEKKDMEEVNAFLDEKGYTFPVLFDINGDVAIGYKVRKYPFTYIIDEKGKITDFSWEVMDKEEMIQKIEKARQNK